MDRGGICRAEEKHEGGVEKAVGEYVSSWAADGEGVAVLVSGLCSGILGVFSVWSK